MRANRIFPVVLVIFAAAVPALADRDGAASNVVVRVTDASGAVIPNARVRLQSEALASVENCRTDATGECGFAAEPRGQVLITVSAPGFSAQTRSMSFRTNEGRSFEFRLETGTVAQEMVVTASQIVIDEERLRQIPGAVDVISSAELAQSRVFTIDEALRKATGVHVRGEEGFALRPNIGIRGLNPTRSTKVLLLEDGLPLSYAPYGDNATYYHPPVERFDTIEVIKGAGQVLYGPSTVGGVINYVTPQPPPQSAGYLSLIGGNRDYMNGHAHWGGTFGSTGVVLDLMRKQGQGARDNLRTGLNDATAKIFTPLTPSQSLTLKANYFGEDSRLTYSGLREAEFRENPRYNPFRNDDANFNRYGAAASHSWAINPSTVLTTNGYGSFFSRDWWRQSSNSNQRPNNASNPNCGGMDNLHTACGIEGRLRAYQTGGVESRARVFHDWLGAGSEVNFGLRAHYEHQDRRQENGPLPTSRAGNVVENNERRTQAYSGFLQNRFNFGKLSLTPGVRLEHVRYQRTNRLTGVRGETNLNQWIPGIAIAYTPSQRVTLFTGLHRGFQPPRAEDIINNTTGGTVDLDPELSWNYEAGARTRVSRSLSIEGTFFRMNFGNQIIPSSVAGGVGATLTSAGRTLHEGAELAGRWDVRSVAGSRYSFSLRSAFTYLPIAEFRGTRFSSVSGFSGVRVTGNRLPYAPKWLMNNRVVVSHASGINALIEMVGTGGQFGDDLNTVNGTPDGQRGWIPGNVIWNGTLNYPVEAWKTTFFVSTKNALDRLYIVDRTRGILPGMPRLLQGGIRYTF
ncbi:MAG: TonB-dependent receptor domain-containing protein [Bryobacteraceae bacterium]